MQIGGQQQVRRGKLVTRKFTLRQNGDASCSPAALEQLLCEGRAYKADFSPAAIGRRRDDFQTSHSATEVPPAASTTPSLPPSNSGVVTVASAAWLKKAAERSRSLSQLAQSIRIQRVQLRHRQSPQSTLRSRDSTTRSTLINPSPDLTAGNVITSVNGE